MVFFGFFALILVLVYWTNQAVRLFDRLIADGQSATVFLEFSALALPGVIRVVLPIAAFVAVVYTTNRLSSESELVVVQASGFSGFRLARPVLAFGLIVALLTAILAHFLVPAANRMLAIRSVEISQNITARFLTEGSFLHPTDGVTFYIREIDASGRLLDVFLSDIRKPDSQITYTAKTAYLVRQDGGAKLVMLDGIAQSLNEKGRLSTTGFSDFSYDISNLVRLNKDKRRSYDELSTFQLLTAGEQIMRETGASHPMLIYAAHKRFSHSLMAIVAALIGFSCLIVGGFSRFGVARQIVAAIVLLILIKTVDNVVADYAQQGLIRWPLIYLAPAVGISISTALLWLSSKPGLLRRLFTRRRQAV